MNIVFTPTAWEQYTDWQRENIKSPRKIFGGIFVIGNSSLSGKHLKLIYLNFDI